MRSLQCKKDEQLSVLEAEFNCKRFVHQIFSIWGFKCTKWEKAQKGKTGCVQWDEWISQSFVHVIHLSQKLLVWFFHVFRSVELNTYTVFNISHKTNLRQLFLGLHDLCLGGRSILEPWRSCQLQSSLFLFGFCEAWLLRCVVPMVVFVCMLTIL